MRNFLRQSFRVERIRFLLLALALGACGCSGPSEADRHNRRLVDAILTAITMKNVHWLDDDAVLAESGLAAGELSEEDYEELVSIIELARQGDWQTAEKTGYEFRLTHPFVRDGQ
jgi:hypothetical protein